MDKKTDLLTRAFANDPFYQTVFKNKSQMSAWFDFLLKYSQKKGLVIQKDHGIAILSKGRPKIWDMIVFGILNVFFKLGIKRTVLFLKIIFLWEQTQKKMNPDHYYLMILAVDPEFQKQKTGSQILNEIQMLCRRDNKTCYLETVTLKNARFYEKNGFQLIETNRFSNYFQTWYFQYS